MAESVTRQGNFSQAGVFVQGFEEDSFHVFGEEVVGELDGADVFVVLKGIYQINETSIVQPAAGEVKFSEPAA